MATVKEVEQEPAAMSAASAKIAERERIRGLIGKIAELGGKGMQEEDIVYTGQKLVLPERWRGDVGAAIKYLEKKRQEDEAVAVFARTYNYRPWDGAYNAIAAMKEAFGMVTGKTVMSFFGPQPPQYIQVPISATETAEVPWGQFEVPLLSGTNINFGASHDDEYGQVFQVIVNAPRKHRFVIEGLFKLIEEKLATNSIYRGQAIDGQDMPRFLDLTGFNDSKIVYSEQVQADLDANVWNVLRHAEANRQLGLPLKRAALFYGPYGTGKSLAGTKTAVEAVANSWTFIMARPGRDNFTNVMQTARLYQPAVVFMEDVDTIANAENQDEISLMLDLFDGIQAKGTELMVILTTNHPETLHKGMMRPGRLDAIIEIGPLDDHGVEKLFRSIIGEHLDKNVDFKPVCEAAKGYLPAFIKEAGDRSVRYALAREDGKIGKYKITTEDLVYAANGLRPQFERMQDAPEFSAGDTLAESMKKIMQGAVAEIATNTEEDGADGITTSVWNVDELTKVQNNQKN